METLTSKRAWCHFKSVRGFQYKTWWSDFSVCISALWTFSAHYNNTTITLISMKMFSDENVKFFFFPIDTDDTYDYYFFCSVSIQISLNYFFFKSCENEQAVKWKMSANLTVCRGQAGRQNLTEGLNQVKWGMTITDILTVDLSC